MGADGEQLNFFGKLMTILHDYGLSKILMGIGLLALIVWALNSENTMDKIINQMIDQHNEAYIQGEIEAIDQRMSVQTEVETILRNLLDDGNADRAYIFEMHNGTNNTAGLPFAYAEMTYEVAKHQCVFVADEFNKLLLSKYKLPYVIYKKGIWYGDYKSLINLDRKLGLRVQANDVKYIMAIRLSGVQRGNAIGWLGISYINTDKPIDIEKTKNSMINASQKLSILLDTVNIN